MYFCYPEFWGKYDGNRRNKLIRESIFIRSTWNNIFFCKKYFVGPRWKALKTIALHTKKTSDSGIKTQALVSFKKYMPPPLPYFKVNICPLPLPHFISIFFAYLWSFRWPNYIATLPRYFSFRLPHLNINTRPPSDELDKNIQRKSHFLFFGQWNGKQPLPVCAGFFISIRNSLDRPCVTMPSWSSPLKCKVSF
jgi:hypothetical protein